MICRLSLLFSPTAFPIINNTLVLTLTLHFFICLFVCFDTRETTVYPAADTQFMSTGVTYLTTLLIIVFKPSLLYVVFSACGSLANFSPTLDFFLSIFRNSFQRSSQTVNILFFPQTSTSLHKLVC